MDSRDHIGFFVRTVAGNSSDGCKGSVMMPALGHRTVS